MEKIIEQVSKDALLSELTKERYVRKTNNGNNEIYIITHHNNVCYNTIYYTISFSYILYCTLS